MSNKKYILLDLLSYSEMNTTERNAYCFYVSLLVKFNNNLIYNVTNKKLSLLTGIHQNTVTKYIKILKKLNLIEYIAENLQLNQLRQEKKLFKLHLYRSLSAANTKLYIETAVLNLHINRQKRAIYIKSLRNRRLTDKERKILKNNPQYLDGVLINDVCFSYRYAAEKLNTSIFKIQTLLKSAEEKGMIKINRVYKFLKKCTSFDDFKRFQATLNSYSDKYNSLSYDFKTNKVFELVGSDIRFKIEFP